MVYPDRILPYDEPEEEDRIDDLRIFAASLPNFNLIKPVDLEFLLKRIVQQQTGYSLVGYCVYGMRYNRRELRRNWERYIKRYQAARTIKKYVIPYLNNPERPTVKARLLSEYQELNETFGLLKVS